MLDSYVTVVDDYRNLDSSVEGDVLVATFDVPDVASRGVGGVLLVDYFHAEGDGGYYLVHDVPMTLRGPDGTVISNQPPGATVDGNAATWSNEETLTDETYVVFAPGRGPIPWLTTRATIAVDPAPFVLSDLVTVSLLPVMILAVTVGLLAAVPSRFDGRSIRRPLSMGVIGVGLATISLLATQGLLVSPSALGQLPALAALAYLGAGVAVFLDVDDVGPRRATAIALASTVGSATFVFGVVHRPPPGRSCR